MKDTQYFPEKPFEIKVSEIKKQPLKMIMIFSYTAFALGIPVRVAIDFVIDEIKNNPYTKNP